MAVAMLAVAERVTDSDLGELLRLEHAVRVRPTTDNRARLRAILHSFEPHGSRYKPDFRFGNLFDAPAVVIDEHLWFQDTDLVTLSDQIDARNDWSGASLPEGVSPWAFDEAPLIALRETWRAKGALVRSVRLRLFGGIDRIARELASLGALDRETHVDAVLQDEETEDLPLARALPNLVGLSGPWPRSERLLSEGAPNLGALTLSLAHWSDACIDTVRSLPAVEELALRGAHPTALQLEAFAHDPLMSRLRSLEISDVNHAKDFPFERLTGLRSRFAHLQQIFVSGHSLPKETRESFSDWPELMFTTWDGRETMAIDFESGGRP